MNTDVTAAAVALPRPRHSDYSTVHDCRTRNPISESLNRLPNALPDNRIRNPSPVEGTAGGTIMPTSYMGICVT